jgi:hypothetical protein
MSAPVAADLLAAGEWESALLIGVAQLLAAELADWTYDDDTSGAVQIALGQAPDQPDRTVTIDSFSVFDQPTVAITEVGVQLRFRSQPNSPLDTKGMASRAHTVLGGRTDTTLGGLFCPLMYRDTSAQLGRDETRRWHRTDNYTITVDLPSTGNRE